jgi:hypothetical protein
MEAKTHIHEMLEMQDQRTIYPINDKTDEQTTLNITKYDSDILQKVVPDVHQYLQEIYNWVAESQPNLSRLTKGNKVRSIVWRKVGQHMPDF